MPTSKQFGRSLRLITTGIFIVPFVARLFKFFQTNGAGRLLIIVAAGQGPFPVQAFQFLFHFVVFIVPRKVRGKKHQHNANAHHPRQSRPQILFRGRTFLPKRVAGLAIGQFFGHGMDAQDDPGPKTIGFEFLLHGGQHSFNTVVSEVFLGPRPRGNVHFSIVFGHKQHDAVLALSAADAPSVVQFGGKVTRGRFTVGGASGSI